jgi:hypothetical protein
MDEEVFNTSIRKFLKKVGITSQIEIEKVITDALSNGEIDQDAVCNVSVQLKIDLSDKPLLIDGEIRLS